MSGVQFLHVQVSDPFDTFDQRVTVTFIKIGTTERTAWENEVSREQYVFFRTVQADMIVLVARSVSYDEHGVHRTEHDRLSISQRLCVDRQVGRRERVHLWIISVHDRLQVLDMIPVTVRDYHGVDVTVMVVQTVQHDIIGTGIDQGSTTNEKDVRGKLLRVGRQVLYVHVSTWIPDVYITTGRFHHPPYIYLLLSSGVCGGGRCVSHPTVSVDTGDDRTPHDTETDTPADHASRTLEGDIATVCSYLETGKNTIRDRSGTIDEVHVLVHPGYSQYNAWYTNSPLTQDHVDAYHQDLKETVEDDSRDGAYTAAFVPRTWEDETSQYLDQFDINPHRILTEPTSSSPTRDGAQDLTALWRSLDTSAEITVSGELHGMCYDHALALLDGIDNRTGGDRTIRQGRYFPETCKVTRQQNGDPILTYSR